MGRNSLGTVVHRKTLQYGRNSCDETEARVFKNMRNASKDIYYEFNVGDTLSKGKKRGLGKTTVRVSCRKLLSVLDFCCGVLF